MRAVVRLLTAAVACRRTLQDAANTSRVVCLRRCCSFLLLTLCNLLRTEKSSHVVACERILGGPTNSAGVLHAAAFQTVQAASPGCGLLNTLLSYDVSASCWEPGHIYTRPRSTGRALLDISTMVMPSLALAIFRDVLRESFRLRIGVEFILPSYVLSVNFICHVVSLRLVATLLPQSLTNLVSCHIQCVRFHKKFSLVELCDDVLQVVIVRKDKRSTLAVPFDVHQFIASKT
jgi:hypothetical protein